MMVLLIAPVMKGVLPQAIKMCEYIWIIVL